MILQIGKRYIRRDGKMTGPLVPRGCTVNKYLFRDPLHCEDYTINGKYIWYDHTIRWPEDLMAEVRD